MRIRPSTNRLKLEGAHTSVEVLLLLKKQTDFQWRPHIATVRDIKDVKKLGHTGEKSRIKFPSGVWKSQREEESRWLTQVGAHHRKTNLRQSPPLPHPGPQSRGSVPPGGTGTRHSRRWLFFRLYSLTNEESALKKEPGPHKPLVWTGPFPLGDRGPSQINVSR